MIFVLGKFCNFRYFCYYYIGVNIQKIQFIDIIIFLNLVEGLVFILGLFDFFLLEILLDDIIKIFLDKDW